MSVRCGIVGTPNAGKSTLFNALTRANVPAESFPFCTIEPNTGSVAVPDPRLQAIAKVVGVEKIIPIALEFVDIAGLVQGASQGEGLGNRFLSHIREMDVIAHVVGRFDDQSDWRGEIDIVNLELMLADLATVSKALDKATRLARTGDKNSISAAETLSKVKLSLQSGQPASATELNPSEKDVLQPLHLLSNKQKFFVMNVAEDEACISENRFEGNVAVPICAEIESELAKMPMKDQNLFRLEMGYDRSAIDSVVQAAYRTLDLSTFFTFNETEVRAWAMPKGLTAKAAAGYIHTDMEKGFIRVEVMPCEDLVSMGSEISVRQAGKLRIEGKNYQPQEGEILRVRFNH